MASKYLKWIPLGVFALVVFITAWLFIQKPAVVPTTVQPRTVQHRVSVISKASSVDTTSTLQVTQETFLAGVVTHRTVRKETHRQWSHRASKTDVAVTSSLPPILDKAVLPQVTAGETPGTGSSMSLGLAFTPNGIGPMVGFNLVDTGHIRSFVGVTEVGLAPGVGLFISGQALPAVDLGAGAILFLGSPSLISYPLGPFNLAPAITMTYRF